jgi:hypothetical protein
MSKNKQQQPRTSTGTAGPKPEAVAVQTEQQLEQNQDQAQLENVEQQPETAVGENKASDAQQETVVESKPVEAPVVEKQKASVSQSQKGFKPVYKVELELAGYAEAMDKKNVMVPEVGGKWQHSLFKAIKSVFAATSQETFNNEFNTILSFFNKNKDGVFNEKFIFRFPECWPGSPNEYTQNRRLVYLIIQTADPKARRKALDEINMELVAEGLPEAHKQMLFNFYLL